MDSSQESVRLRTKLPVGSMHEQVVHFSRALHAEGLCINSARLIDFFRCFEYIDIQSKSDFHAAGLAVLVSKQEDIALYDTVFELYWARRRDLAKNEPSNNSDGDDCDDDPADEEKARSQPICQPNDEPDDDPAGDSSEQSLTFSQEETLLHRDLGTLTEADVEQARHLIKDLVKIIASQWNRRKVADKRGQNLDFRRMLRQSALYSSEGFTQLKYLSRRRKKPKLVLLCDVSGSMQGYSHFLIRFMYGLRSEIADLEVAVFSTQLTVITNLLRSKGVEESLSQVADYVKDWAGGTDIGGCLETFNRDSAAKMVRSRSVVIILSDGWDRGNADVLSEQIVTLKRRAHRLLWLNPLLGSSGYQPLCRGMATALPHLDYFLPAHNLKSLAQLAKTLKSAW